jgi:hypothetical protein
MRQCGIRPARRAHQICHCDVMAVASRTQMAGASRAACLPMQRFPRLAADRQSRRELRSSEADRTGDRVLLRTRHIEAELLSVIEVYLDSRANRFPGVTKRKTNAASSALSRWPVRSPPFVGRNGERITRGTLQSRIKRAFKRAGPQRAAGAAAVHTTTFDADDLTSHAGLLERYLYLVKRRRRRHIRWRPLPRPACEKLGGRLRSEPPAACSSLRHWGLLRSGTSQPPASTILRLLQ